MGDATTAVSNDSSAVFGNPAGVARLRNPRSRWNLHLLTVPDLSIGGSSATVRAMSGNVAAPKRWIGGFSDAVRARHGTSQNLEMQMFPAAVLGGKGTPTYLVGLPARHEASARIPIEQVDPANPKASLSSDTTISGAFAVAENNRAGNFSYGFSLRPNVRYSYSNAALEPSTLGYDTLKNAAFRNGKKTIGVGADAGFLYTAMDYWFPTFGVTIRNIPTGCVARWLNPATGKFQQVCGSKRSGSASESLPTSQIDPTDLRVGLSLTPRFPLDGLRANLRLSADAHSLPVTIAKSNYGLANTPFQRLWNAGAELFFGHPFIQDGIAVRAGMHQNQPTYGASFIIPGFSIEFASYTMQTNTASEPPRFDRRSLLGISSRW